MSNRLTARLSASAGFTLIELLIYMAFAVIVLTIVAAMLISTVTAEKSITARAEATTAGQFVSQSVHSGMRNATRLKLTSGKTDQLLIMEAVGGAEVAVTTCEAWYYTSANTGALYFMRSAPQPGQKITMPSLANRLKGWTLIAHGVAPADAQRAVFVARNSQARPSAVPGSEAYIDPARGIGRGATVTKDPILGTTTATGVDAIDLAFTVTIRADNAPVSIESTSISRGTSSGAGACF